MRGSFEITQGVYSITYLSQKIISLELYCPNPNPFNFPSSRCSNLTTHPIFSSPLNQEPDFSVCFCSTRFLQWSTGGARNSPPWNTCHDQNLFSFFGFELKTMLYPFVREWFVECFHFWPTICFQCWIANSWVLLLWQHIGIHDGILVLQHCQINRRTVLMTSFYIRHIHHIYT